MTCVNPPATGIPFWNAGQLRSVLGFEDLMEATRDAFVRASRGEYRSDMLVLFPGARPEEGDVYVKTGYRPGGRFHLVKVSPWFAAVAANRQPQGGFVAVLDSATGRTVGLIDDQHYLSDQRTAAAGAVIARALAPPVVQVAAVLGAGTQAELQARALFLARPFRKLLIWARDRERGAALAARLAPYLAGVHIEVMQDLEETVRAAEVLLCCTQAREPLVRGEWLRSGCHVTAIGADDATKCELDAASLMRARVFVDARDMAERHGDVHRAIRDGGYSLSAVAGEIGELLDGQIPGRLHASDITIAKLVGLGAQDLAAAEMAVDRLLLRYP
jgi:ornithine cyclodeaminase/alanine dehydrogenase-like protein (mu-crystallin family)